MRLPSGSHPTAPHLEEDRDHVATDGDVEAGVYSVALRQLVTNATPAGDHPVKGVEALEVVPGAAAPAERDQAEALPELPAQLRSSSAICSPWYLRSGTPRMSTYGAM